MTERAQRSATQPDEESTGQGPGLSVSEESSDGAGSDGANEEREYRENTESSEEIENIEDIEDTAAGAEPANQVGNGGHRESSVGSDDPAGTGDLGDTLHTSTPVQTTGSAAEAGDLTSRTLPVSTPDEMRALGQHLAGFLRPGDLVVLNGHLGAGKTTFVQGVGAGLGVQRSITSPTFVIARVHPPSPGGLPLVHVDAYRLGGVAEIDDLDLDTPAEEAVTIVEWGEGLVEDLADDRLEITISRGEGEERQVRFTGVGRRWHAASLFA